MKRLLILLLIVCCIIPFASAIHPMNITPSEDTIEGFPATNAIDGNPDTWARMVNGNAYLRVCFPSATNLTSFSAHHAYDSHDTLERYVGIRNFTTPAGWNYEMPVAYASSNSTDINPMIMFGECFYVGTDPVWGGFNMTEVSFTGYNATYSDLIPVVDFTGTPLIGVGPLYVSFTDNSTNEIPGSTTYNWTISPMDGVLAAPGDLDNEDLVALFTENGNFTISHGVETPYGSGNLTRNEYVWIRNSTELATFRVRAVDAISGYGVNGANVSVYDIENASWTNQTSVTGEVTVTMLTGHTFDAYGSATGYDDGESLALPAVSGSLYPIYMWPTSTVTNVSEGNVTLYVTVLEDGTNIRLSGYSLSLTGPSSGGADYTAGVTNENGIFQATIRNQTNYAVKVLAQKAHLGANKNFYSGNQSGGDSYVEVTLWLGVNTITTAPTATTLPGGGTPTPTLTYLANCDPDASDYDAAKCRTSKGGMGLNILADNLEGLIWICLIVTVIYLFKGIGK